MACKTCPKKAKKEPKRFIIEVSDEFHKDVKDHARKVGHESYRSWIMGAIINTMAREKTNLKE